ncbi:MAG: NADH-quinone oxidoreductase subunit C [Planctomycetes bacterium]|nr:NADH-quinone oxidoreductase subunit C [Planctomycetota bacterium]
MTANVIFEKLRARFGEGIEFQDNSLLPFIKVRPDSIRKVADILRNNPDLGFDSLMCLTAVDNPANFTIVYFLFSMKHQHKVTLKVETPKDNPNVPTVEKIWSAANWFEREVYDLFGVKFDGHSNLVRIMLPDDWEGYPLRKDYQYPATYRGLPL